MKQSQQPTNCNNLNLNALYISTEWASVRRVVEVMKNGFVASNILDQNILYPGRYNVYVNKEDNEANKK